MQFFGPVFDAPTSQNPMPACSLPVQAETEGLAQPSSLTLPVAGLGPKVDHMQE